MGRRRPKFSFPIPGRKPATGRIEDDAGSIPSSIPSIPSAADLVLRYDDSPTGSKAEQLLGLRPLSRSRSSVPQSPGFMTVTVSEASFGSEYTDDRSFVAAEDSGRIPPQRPAMVPRASSNLLGSMYNGDGRRGSANSSMFSKRLLPTTSNSTMRSYYDPQKSPLSISQQTSASAVRDMALRKGQPSVTSLGSDTAHHVDNVPYHTTPQPSKSQGKKMKPAKPARLDLSKLFPKPKDHAEKARHEPLLSPNKLVNSPVAMSTKSDYFPHPMTRESTPTPKGRGKLRKQPSRSTVELDQHPVPQSPVRTFKRDTYDNAKVNVRRPPRGIKHWFEGLDEESDEDCIEEKTHVAVQTPVAGRQPATAPRKSSLGRVLQDVATPAAHSPHFEHGNSLKKMQFAVAHEQAVHRLTSPSSFSVQTQGSMVSTKTKESGLSKRNLQDSSVLSFSSSEDEEETEAPGKNDEAHTGIGGHEGEVIIGKAQACEVRPRLSGRAVSESKMSILSTSTSAATIEVMYSPDPYPPPPNVYRPQSHRKSTHSRQPSVIPENGDASSQQPVHARPMSSSSISVRSGRTSRSEPHSRKLMAVTEEEEALLEMMRRKRAAMAKHSFTEGYKTAILQEARQKTPPEEDHPTSAFLTTESPSTRPATATAALASSRPNVPPPQLMAPPARGRLKLKTLESSSENSILRDSSTSSSTHIRSQAIPRSDSPSRRLRYRLSPEDFSPFDASFPSPAPTPTSGSVASPTSTTHSHASPLPSPVTPGLRNGHSDIRVKVASSEPSLTGDEDVIVNSNGIIEPPSEGMKSESTNQSSHQRRRTASSGAEVPTVKPLQRTSSEPLDSITLATVAEQHTRSNTPSIVEPKPYKRSSRRTGSISTSNSAHSRHSATPSFSSSARTSSPATRGLEVPTHSRKSSMRKSTRCSVSEDVLAAWGSLGGWRDFEQGGRALGM